MVRVTLATFLVATSLVGLLYGCDDASTTTSKKDVLDTAEDTTGIVADVQTDLPADLEDSVDSSTVETTEVDQAEDTQVAETTVPDTADSTDTAELPPVLGGVGEPCDAVQLCAASLICAGGFCAQAQGACATDSDCQSDTYCCTTGCGPQPVCIRYGEGPRGNLNTECKVDIVPGLFEARTQCEWSGPPAGDLYPDHVQVLTTPMVADLPNDSAAAVEIVIVSYNYSDGGNEAALGTNPAYFGVLRILNGQTCEQLESIDDVDNRIIASAPPAIADLDNDGTLEIVAQRALNQLIAFKWDTTEQRFVRYWVTTDSAIGSGRWDGPAIHDINHDNYPEVISGSEVFDGRTGVRLNPGQNVPGAGAGVLSVVGDLNVDGYIDLIGAGLWSWNLTTSKWDLHAPGAPASTHYGFADFGTPGATAADFDPTTLDGEAEIVTSGGNVVRIYTLSGQQLMNATGISGGGPPTIGDFDNDGFPEVASAGGYAYRVFDLDCAAGGPGCVAPYIRWSQPSQDLSSSTTGSSIFDFEGDGKAEAVYADECFTRIYDGQTGEVLFSSFRTSCTWYENAVVADVDRDSNTEILVGSNANCNIGCPSIDPIHVGLRCVDGSECVSGVCDTGYCRCTADAECDPEYRCIDPPVGTAGTGMTCRAYHPPGVGLTGLRVMRDRLDRWASSRPMWNQHVYNVSNILDNGRVPYAGNWPQNFRDPDLNNFRQNVQGDLPADLAPDLTGRFDDAELCEFVAGGVSLSAWVCNRGSKPVGAAMPATFYLGDPALADVLCTSYTAGPVPVGECMEVSCIVAASVTGDINMVVNDDGAGDRTTIECDETNNTDVVSVENCIIN